MKRTYLSLGVLVALCFIIMPEHTQAYFTTNQTSVRINEHTALYAIEYAFGLPKYDIYMPVLAERNLTNDSSIQKVGYSIQDDDNGVVEHGTTYGMVVAKAPIVDSMYKLEKGKAQKMTLYIIYTTASTTPEADYKLQVDSLPFYVDIKSNGKIEDLETRQLNPSELIYYVTRNVELNSKPRIKNIQILAPQ